MKLTIFTALYNRKKYLPRLYDSLKRQESNDFEWLIVDDGSTDSPEELILPWIDQEKSFPIRFFQKENGGKHTATNLALEIAAGDFFLFLDSDDYLADHAVSLISQWIDNLQPDFKQHKLLGVAGQKINPAGEYLLWRTADNGHQIPYGGMPTFETILECTMTERINDYHMRGDCCEVFRTDVLKQYPYPVFSGEKFLAEHAVYSILSKECWKIQYHKDALEVCEYQLEGLSFDAHRFIRNPKGWGYVIQVEQSRKEEKTEQEYQYFQMLFDTLSWHEICENLGITDGSAFQDTLLSHGQKKLLYFSEITEAVNVYENIQQQLVLIPKESDRFQTVSHILQEVSRLLLALDAEICYEVSEHDVLSARQLLKKKQEDCERAVSFLSHQDNSTLYSS